MSGIPLVNIQLDLLKVMATKQMSNCKKLPKRIDKIVTISN